MYEEPEQERETMTPRAIREAYAAKRRDFANIRIVRDDDHEELFDSGFHQAKLDYSDFTGVTFPDWLDCQHLSLREATLVKATFKSHYMNYISLVNVSATNLRLDHATLDHANCSYGDFHDMVAYETSLQHSNWDLSLAKSAHFSGCDLAHSIFSHVHLEGAHFEYCTLPFTSWNRAKAQGVSFYGSSGVYADYVGIELDEKTTIIGENRSLIAEVLRRHVSTPDQQILIGEILVRENCTIWELFSQYRRERPAMWVWLQAALHPYMPAVRDR